jgi:hypothetical protein
VMVIIKRRDTKTMRMWFIDAMIIVIAMELEQQWLHARWMHDHSHRDFGF